MANEVARRAVHMSGVVLPGAYLLGVLSYAQLRWTFVVGSLVTIGLEAVRLLIGLDWRLYDVLTREYEQRNLAGYALYMLASTAVVLVFEPRVALPAVLMLMVADPISGLLGSGELRATKAASVILVTFAVCLVLAYPFVPLLPAVLGAAAATFADGVKPVIWGYVIDDNASIPVLAAVGIAVGLWVTGGAVPSILG
ncbi:dolichol kinase [Halococcus sp. IIIV-5B]|uniref:dolichol kinase n=1 Tax=Halococcus sp. IIIV-5B TaxID=2321230 RepID=UPI000E75D03D|nr:dolichol kinase [Halococcus sp. IIIV-5B]RJT04089.1 dolichol kinase [Halococcus sp. IIIV-5B]